MRLSRETNKQAGPGRAEPGRAGPGRAVYVRDCPITSDLAFNIINFYRLQGARYKYVHSLARADKLSSECLHCIESQVLVNRRDYGCISLAHA